MVVLQKKIGKITFGGYWAETNVQCTVVMVTSGRFWVSDVRTRMLAPEQDLKNVTNCSSGAPARMTTSWGTFRGTWHEGGPRSSQDKDASIFRLGVMRESPIQFLLRMCKKKAMSTIQSLQNKELK